MCYGRQPDELASDLCGSPTMNVIKAKVGSKNDWVYQEFNITVPAVIEKVWGLGEAKVGDVVEITGPRRVVRDLSDSDFDAFDEEAPAGYEDLPAPMHFGVIDTNSCDTEEMEEGESVMLWWNGSGKLRRFFCEVLFFRRATEDYVDSVSSNLNC